MSTKKKTASVGFKTEESVKEDLEELAHERRMTVSELLRDEVRRLLENADEIDA